MSTPFSPIFIGLVVMISACHQAKRGRPGFDSQMESIPNPFLILECLNSADC